MTEYVDKRFGFGFIKINYIKHIHVHKNRPLPLV